MFYSKDIYLFVILFKAHYLMYHYKTKSYGCHL
jgi:hypothetical protein